MMKEEFEQRFGQEIDWDVYGRIELMYVDGDKDKDAFVTWVKRNQIVAKVQTEMIKELKGKIHEIEVACTTTKNDNYKIVNEYVHNKNKVNEALEYFSHSVRMAFYEQRRYFEAFEKWSEALHILDIINGISK